MSTETSTPDLDKIRETLKKLAVLAERGEENERQTALGLLQKLLHKYNLTIPDLVNTDLKEREFSYSSRDNLTILSQCIWSINPDAQVNFDSGKNKVYVKLKSSDYIEVVEKFLYYYPLYEKEKMKLMLAFICKHGLTTTTNSCSGNDNNMTEEEVKQVMLIMSGMTKGSFATTRKMVDKNSK
ncbi:MAG: DUF2786 domain-containing protein [Bacteroidia bacterium]|nr:DUF2786 domain-containing protein [Bacteroidia bacterium]